MESQPPAPFVVGLARSGTTLLRMMLDAHSNLAIPPETFWVQPLVAYRWRGADAAVEAAVRHRDWEGFNLPADEFASRVRAEDAESFGDVMRVFYRLYAERRGKVRWGDKSPYYCWVMTDLQQHLPEASFIHIVRDGRDAALSLIKQGFGPDSVAEAAERWRQILESARQQAPDLCSYHEVRYEDLVRDPVGTLKPLCEVLELDWEAQMLEYHREAARRLAEETVELQLPHRVVSRDERLSIHRLLDRPPQQGRVERWRTEMSRSDLLEFERIAGETLECFGYELSGVGTRGS